MFGCSGNFPMTTTFIQEGPWKISSSTKSLNEHLFTSGVQKVSQAILMSANDPLQQYWLFTSQSRPFGVSANCMLLMKYLLDFIYLKQRPKYKSFQFWKHT
ncbi:unnamed protein product [Cylicocyclus nassatus]|uniref:Uncharacterized protein n=1 Tax=Cylicocyclus nassatus TaxID=53992 RepID=A0AA36DN41_CYLNA|nr:unnamed protein product [Cylicocyclus nassatus]